MSDISDSWRWDKWAYDQELKKAFEAHLAAGGDVDGFVAEEYGKHPTFCGEAKTQDYRPDWTMDQILTLIKVAVVAATKDPTDKGLAMLQRFIPQQIAEPLPTVREVVKKQREVRTDRGEHGEPPDITMEMVHEAVRRDVENGTLDELVEGLYQAGEAQGVINPDGSLGIRQIDMDRAKEKSPHRHEEKDQETPQ
jgi:hypothetical protein